MDYRRLLFSLFCILFATNNMLFAFGVISQGISYDIISENTVQVTYNKDHYKGDIVIPDHIEDNGTTYSVIGIGSYAFKDCTDLTSINLPNSILAIGKYAFSGCSSLKSISLPKNVSRIMNSAFEYCSNLNDIELPDGLLSIGANVFYHCKNLTHVKISNNIIEIGNKTFEGCKKLQYTKHENCLYLGNHDNPFVALIKTFNTDILKCNVHDKCRCISDDAFSGCKNLMNINISDNTLGISRRPFEDCLNLQYNVYKDGLYLGNESNPYLVLIKTNTTNITSCTIHDNCRFIGNAAFYKCTNLKHIDITENVYGIGNSAFNGCTSMTYILIPQNIAYIGNNAFAKCENLKTIFNCSNLSLQKESFDFGRIAYNAKQVYNKCSKEGDFYFSFINGKKYIIKYIGTETNLSLPQADGILGYPDEGVFCNSSDINCINISEGMTSIGNYAFYNLKKLSSVFIPNSVISIEDNAFDGCSELTSVHLPVNLMNIGDKAFYGCSKITIIHIPNNVKHIGDNAFDGCTGMTSIFLPKNITEIGSGVFQGCTSLSSITIPHNVVKINRSAFFGCTNLKTIFNCSSLPLIKGSYDYGYVATCAQNIYNNCMTKGDFYLINKDGKKYVIRYIGTNPDIFLPEVDGIWEESFKGLTLISITIPKSITYIGKNAFENCTGKVMNIRCNIEDAESKDLSWFHGSKFNEIVISEEVSKIGNNAFNGLAYLEKLSIGKNVNRIGYNAFEKCSNLKSIYLNTQEPPHCRNTAFDDDTKWDCTLYVLPNQLEIYKTAEVWKSFINIKEMK